MSWSAAACRPPAKSPLRKLRRDGLVDDLLGRQVGNRAFQRLGHLDADLAVVLGHHQQHAVADALAADLPGVAHAVGVAGDVLRLRGRHHQHRDLRALGLLKRGQLVFQPLELDGVERAGLVDDARRQRRNRLHALRPGARPASAASSSRPRSSLTRSGPRAWMSSGQCRCGAVTGGRVPGRHFLLKSTDGGVEICASFCTVKLGLGW